MNDTPPSIPPAIAAVPSTPAPDSADQESAGSTGLSERHQAYAKRFHDWLLGLNRHDFLQAKKLLDQMMYAYTKHVVRLKSPPAREEGTTDVPGTTRDGEAGSDLPDGAPGS